MEMRVIIIINHNFKIKKLGRHEEGINMLQYGNFKEKLKNLTKS